jgi:hypothetical protein
VQPLVEAMQRISSMIFIGFIVQTKSRPGEGAAF